MGFLKRILNMNFSKLIIIGCLAAVAHSMNKDDIDRLWSKLKPHIVTVLAGGKLDNEPLSRMQKHIAIKIARKVRSRGAQAVMDFKNGKWEWAEEPVAPAKPLQKKPVPQLEPKKPAVVASALHRMQKKQRPAPAT